MDLSSRWMLPRDSVYIHHESHMDDTKRKHLNVTVTNLKRRWGVRAVVSAREVQPETRVVSTCFPKLDRLLGIGGVPLSAITFFRGQATSGKLTLGYKILRSAQHASATPRTPPLPSVAILDLNMSSDPDYVTRCGIDLDHLLLVRPSSGKQAIDVLIDLVRSRQFRAILLDSLPDLNADPATARYFDRLLPQLSLFLKTASCALIILDESQPPWLESLSGNRSSAIYHYASLHMEFQRERWIEAEGELRGYLVQARIVKSHHARSGQVAHIAIEFNDTVRARDAW